MSKVSHEGHKGVELCVSWQPGSGGHIPPNAVEAGPGVFVARAQHNGEWTPGKVAQGHPNCYVAYGGKEHAVPQYEVLVSSGIGCYGKGYKWVGASHNNVPKNALVGGSDRGTPLFISRGRVGNDVCVGKVHKGHGCAYYPHGGAEHKQDGYEVLVLGDD